MGSPGRPGPQQPHRELGGLRACCARVVPGRASLWTSEPRPRGETSAPAAARPGPAVAVGVTESSTRFATTGLGPHVLCGHLFWSQGSGSSNNANPQVRVAPGDWHTSHCGHTHGSRDTGAIICTAQWFQRIRGNSGTVPGRGHKTKTCTSPAHTKERSQTLLQVQRPTQMGGLTPTDSSKDSHKPQIRRKHGKPYLIRTKCPGYREHN